MIRGSKNTSTDSRRSVSPDWRRLILMNPDRIIAFITSWLNRQRGKMYLHRYQRPLQRWQQIFLWMLLICCLPMMAVSQLPVRQQTHIYGIGNDLMAERPLESSSRGWMQVLPMFFPINFHFENLAKSNLTLKTFARKGGNSEWAELQPRLRPNDLVLISFAPFEDRPADPLIQQVLNQVLNGIQAAGAKAVIVAPFKSDVKSKVKSSVTSATKRTTRETKSETSERTQTNQSGNTDYLSSPLHLYYQLPASGSTAEAATAAERPYGHGHTLATGGFTHKDDSIPLYAALVIARQLATDMKAELRINTEAIVKTRKTAITSGGAKSPDTTTGDSLATVVSDSDAIAKALKLEAAHDFLKFQSAIHSNASTVSGWQAYAKELRTQLMQHSGVKVFHHLNPDLHETGRIQEKGYSIRKIYFQTRPGIYATANLYVPDGKGPFPAIINSHGHWPDGKAGEMVQSCAISLAQNGYVCLNIDAWGAGERTTREGVAEYHGSNLGATLLDIGESLLGNQVTDNIRGVDLLCSLPFVDSSRIGATGASGGGNQTMWLGALDTRIKACMPVVSVGTFQSYIMGSNCVCELMPGGLTLTEESGILALMAPRSLKICSALKDASPTFAPTQMCRSFAGAMPIYNLMRQGIRSADNNPAESNGDKQLRYQLFNTPHGYFPEMRAAMLGWFDLTLKGKGDGGFVPEKPVRILPPGRLSVFQKGGRSPLITTTVSYDQQIGRALNTDLLTQATAHRLDVTQKRATLKNMLGLPAPDSINRLDTNLLDTAGMVNIKNIDSVQDLPWKTGTVFTRNNHVIPFKLLAPTRADGKILIVCVPDSSVLAVTDASTSISANRRQKLNYRDQYLKQHFGALIQAYQKRGDGILIADLWGLGAAGSSMGRKVNGALPLFHTLARADIWFGRTVVGEWVSDLHVLRDFVRVHFGSHTMDLAAGKEVAVAALAANALGHSFSTLYLDHLLLDYVVDDRQGMDYFNMAIHLPGILNWGNVSLIAGLNKGTRLKIIDPVTITGKTLNDQQLNVYRKQFNQVNAACGGNNIIEFGIESDN